MSHHRTNMLMFFIISTLLVAAECQHQQLFDSTYNDDDSNEADTPEKNKCMDIASDITDCYSCYFCDHERIIAKSKDRINVVARLNISDSRCSTKEFCCIPQTALTVRNRDKCGDFNPEGNPRSVRTSLRSVLPGEYPWRAWLYNSERLLCPATYIREDAKAFITSASCVKDHMNEPLFIRFSKTGKPSKVTRKIVNPNPGSDLLFLQVDELPSISWILPSCMPVAPAVFGSTCIAISDDDHFVITAIPKPIVCAEANMQGPGIMCAVAPSNDYRPAPGSALVCPDHSSKTIKYIISGIALETTPEGYTKYTDVYHYIEWLKDQM